MPAPAIICFGPFELDSRSRELRKQGTPIKVQDQPLLILQILLERPGELVTREELRNRLWPSGTFVDFDHSLNTAVKKLRNALDDNADAPRYIETLPRRGYRLLAPIIPDETPSEPEVARASFPKLPLALLALTGLAGLWIARPRPVPPQSRLVPLTTFAGVEAGPSFSPDGRQIVFTWNGEKRNNYDIYVKLVGEANALRLTFHPAIDAHPAWSPDGSQIAFARFRPDFGLFLISPLGGVERKLADYIIHSKPSWHPDGKSILVSTHYNDASPAPGGGSLILVSVNDSHQPRTILAPPPGKWFRDAAISPDARSLAYASCEGPMDGKRCTILVTALTSDLLPTGEPRVVAPPSSATFGIAWTPDSTGLVYSNLGNDGISHLWSRDLRGDAEPVQIQLAGNYAYLPDIDAAGRRLAFARATSHPQIWRIFADGKMAPFLTSSTRDHSPQFSPDGRRIAFSSDRHEHMAIWSANADGSSPTQVTRLPNMFAGTPRWSPDGRFLAFDSSTGNAPWKIWVVEAGGNSPRQITNGPGDDAMPSWSLDGQWIFFGSKRTGRFEIWRVSPHGGEPQQVTGNGGHAAFTSLDGKSIYYTRSTYGEDGLWTKSFPDGEERQIIKESITGRAFVPVADKIYYLHCEGAVDCHLRTYEFSSGRSRNLTDIEGPIYLGLTLSPDRKDILFAKYTRDDQDLHIIENFR